MMDEYDDMIQVMVVGDASVGKTCISEVYTNNKFNSNSLSTIAIDFKLKLTTVLGKKIKMQIWDTAGQERFNTLTSNFFKGSDGILLVYSITNKKSYMSISRWMNNIKEQAPDYVKVLLFANKIDLEGKREVTTQEGRDLADKYDIGFMEGSAKTGKNVTEAFKALSERIVQNMDQDRKNKLRHDLMFASNDPSKKKNCCS